MTKYIASVRDKETRELKIIEMEYPTAKAFREDLYGNGYRVRFITTEEKFDEDCEKYHRRWEINKKIKNEIYASLKKYADKRGMTVAEYKRWLKG